MKGPVVAVTVNGEKMEFDRELTIAELLHGLGLPEKGVFVEFDREPLHRSDYARMRIFPGANIEIVTMMAGG